MNFIDAYTAALVLVAILSLLLSSRALAWPANGAREFGFIQLGIAVYAVAYAAELAATSLTGALRAIRLEYVGIVAMMIFWIVFALRFSGRFRLRPTLACLVAFLPLCTLAMVWTDSSHHLFYARSWMQDIGVASILMTEKGPWYWVHVANFWTFLALNFAILLPAAHRASPQRRAQITLVLGGSFVPAAAEIVHLLGLMPYGLDPIPLAFSITGLLFGAAVFRGRFLAVALAARGPVLQAMSAGVIVVDRYGNLADVNPAAAVILGLSQDSIGCRLLDLAPGREELDAILTTGDGKSDFLVVTEARVVRRYTASAFPIKDGIDRRVGTAAIIEDVTEAAAHLDRLVELAMTDELTGLLNRRSFLGQGNQAFELSRRAGRPVAVAVYDLDHFKRVNDSRGHPAGDAVLREVAIRLSDCMRAGDSLCRFGGEEFALLMPDTDEAGAVVAVERLRAAVGTELVPWTGGPIAVTSSAGLFASVPGPGDSLEGFLEKADEALYMAKRRGRNRLELGRPGRQEPEQPQGPGNGGHYRPI